MRKKIKIFLMFLLIGVTSCYKFEKETPIPLTEFKAYCEIYDLEEQSYTNDIKIKFKIQPIVFDVKPLDVKHIENSINDKFNSGGFYFEVQEPIFKTLLDNSTSYIKLLRDNYKSSEIRMLVVPEKMILYEDEFFKVAGAADNIPELYNIAKAKPTFFIRREYIYTNINSHELGHVFGLKHTFHDQDLRNKGANCDTGDRIQNTITPHPEVSVYMSDCSIFAPNHIREIYTENELVNMAYNMESYSPEHCMIEFVPEQFMRMRKILELNPRLQDCIIDIGF
jgi:hypothetical protein